MYAWRKIKYRLGFYKSGKRKNGFSFLAGMLIVMTAIVVIASATEQRISSLAIRLGEIQHENEVRTQCNKIVSELLEEYGGKLNTFEEKKGENGITYTKINFAEMNNFKGDLTARLTDFLITHNEIVSCVPIGALVSDDIFAAQGTKIPVKITSAGTANVEFTDDFISGGINQTRHRLMLKITVRIQLHTVREKTEKIIETEIPISEQITIGEVPSFMNVSD